MENDRFDPRPGEDATLSLPPGRETPEMQRARRTSLVLFAILLIAEAIVAVAWSMLPGLFLILCTAGLLVVVERLHRNARGQREEAFYEFLETYAESFYADGETGLPNRQHLVEQLGREIARADRYSYSLTMAMFEIVRMDDLAEAWGDEVAERGLLHVSETLRRVCRTSDFIARVSPTKFSAVLVQCNEEQGRLFGERVALAVANRPLKRDGSLKLPLYVNVQFSVLEYAPQRFRGPLEYLSAAGGELTASATKKVARQQPKPADAVALRKQMVEDYYPGGQMKDFAEAYADFKDRGRRAG